MIRRIAEQAEDDDEVYEAILAMFIAGAIVGLIAGSTLVMVAAGVIWS